jgi:hypothetical protein
MLGSIQLIGIPRRALTSAMALVLLLGALTLAAEATTIRLVPSLGLAHPESHLAFPGELIEVQLGDLTPPVTSNPDVVRPLQVTSHPSSGYFMAAKPGEATLRAVSIGCDRCDMPSFLWLVTIEVRLPGP